MSWWLYLLVFVLMLVRVWAKAAQQLHVTYDQKKRVPLTSYVQAAGEIAMLSLSAHFVYQHNWLGLILTWFVYGTSGWMGSLWAMHRHFGGYKDGKTGRRENAILDAAGARRPDPRAVLAIHDVMKRCERDQMAELNAVLPPASGRIH